MLVWQIGHLLDRMAHPIAINILSIIEHKTARLCCGAFMFTSYLTDVGGDNVMSRKHATLAQNMTQASSPITGDLTLAVMHKIFN